MAESPAAAQIGSRATAEISDDHAERLVLQSVSEPSADSARVTFLPSGQLAAPRLSDLISYQDGGKRLRGNRRCPRSLCHRRPGLSRLGVESQFWSQEGDGCAGIRGRRERGLGATAGAAARSPGPPGDGYSDGPGQAELAGAAGRAPGLTGRADRARPTASPKRPLSSALVTCSRAITSRPRRAGNFGWHRWSGTRFSFRSSPQFPANSHAPAAR